MDFLTFGELSDIIKGDWDVFGALFSSAKAVERVMANLNTLRGPIAHCTPLAEDEVVRLRLAVRDWFRLSEQRVQRFGQRCPYRPRSAPIRP